MSTYRFSPFLFLAMILMVFASCNGGKKSVEAAEEIEEVLPEDIVELRADQIKLANITTGTIEMRSLSGTLNVSGTIAVAPQNLATVCMPMGGFVKSTSLMPGTSVRKGQMLAIIENQDFVDIQQNYLEARNKLAYAKSEYERQSELYKSDVSSQKSLQLVTSEYKTLRAQVNAFAQKLALIGINPARLNENNISRSVAVVSPVSGFVKAVNVNIGKFVNPSDVLFEIVNSDKLYLELTLFEKDADKISTGQKIRFTINSETEQHEAVIAQTCKSINADKTCKVYARVLGSCKNILPGMYVNAFVEASSGKVTAVPADAVVSFDEKDYIFVFDKNKEEDGKPFTEYRMIEVHKGVTDAGYTEIGLPDGFDIQTAKVVIKGAYNLLSAKKNAGEMAC